MPDFSVGVQLGVELTRIFGTQVVQKAAQSAYDSVLALARNLRLSGSDLLVEADLADILGRAKIEPGLEQNFRNQVLQTTEIKPIQQGSILALSTGAGPTLTEASSRTKDGLMASVIQLSFLGWVHGRVSLASTLDDCLNKRFEINIPGAKPSPGFSGIIGALDACSSQTSDFDWNLYLDPVRRRLQASSMLLPKTSNDSISLSASVLQACLDCLYIVQRVPEERFMIAREPDGLLTLVVWAYYLLGLTVVVIDHRHQKRAGFPSDDCQNPSIIIEFNATARSSPCITVLDSSKDEIVRIEPGEDAPAPMETRERLRLRGYGTIMLCRHLDESLDTFLQEPDNPALVEGAQVTIAMARLISQRLVRISGTREKPVISDRCNINRRKLYDAARVFFAHPFSQSKAERIPYEESSSEGHLEMMKVAKSWNDVQLPATFRQRRYLHPNGQPMIRPITFLDLSITLLCIAAIVGIEDCADIKLVLNDNFESKSNFELRISEMNNAISFLSHDLLSHISRLLVARELSLNSPQYDDAGEGNCFMVSDFGWTVSLPTFGDNDPFTVSPDSLFIRKGTPTNAKTLERKNRVHDALPPGIEMMGNVDLDRDWVRDRGKQTYDPRCDSPVRDRVEYYGSRENGFHLLVKFKGEHLENFVDQRPCWFEVNQSCRGFHEGLWQTVTAPPCQHGPSSYATGEVAAARLGLGVATAWGVWSWAVKETGTPVPEKVVVVLVKGDARARWLAIGNIVKEKQNRRTMLRGKHCCENCAVEAAASRPGKWFVVI